MSKPRKPSAPLFGQHRRQRPSSLGEFPDVVYVHENPLPSPLPFPTARIRGSGSV